MEHLDLHFQVLFFLSQAFSNWLIMKYITDYKTAFCSAWAKVTKKLKQSCTTM